MALLYPWATKEYLLWEMTIGQIILYHNKGMEIKYPDPNKKSNYPGLNEKSIDELRSMRDDARTQFESEKAENMKKELKAKYGDI
jgi:hypothetical protein